MTPCGLAICHHAWHGGLVTHNVSPPCPRPETGSEIDHCPGCGESVVAWLADGGDALRLVDGVLLDEPPGLPVCWRAGRLRVVLLVMRIRARRRIYVWL